MKLSAVPLVLLLGTLATAWAQASAAAPDTFPTAKITTQQLDSYKSEVEAVPDIQCREIWAHQRQCSSAAQNTIWTFTLPGHPAHPAVSRGVMVVQQTSQGATIGIDRSGHYAGDAAAFEAWLKEFHALDQKQVAQWQSMLKPK
jgi:hypothetical protein